jgi:hypothetical protein
MANEAMFATTIKMIYGSLEQLEGKRKAKLTTRALVYATHLGTN